MKIPDNIISAVDSLLEPYGGIKALATRDKGDTSKRWMSIEEAETYSGLNRWMLWDAARKGSFRQSKLGKARASKVLIDKNSFDQWLESHCG